MRSRPRTPALRPSLLKSGGGEPVGDNTDLMAVEQRGCVPAIVEFDQVRARPTPGHFARGGR